MGKIKDTFDTAKYDDDRTYFFVVGENFIDLYAERPPCDDNDDDNCNNLAISTPKIRVPIVIDCSLRFV